MQVLDYFMQDRNYQKLIPYLQRRACFLVKCPVLLRSKRNSWFEKSQQGAKRWEGIKVILGFEMTNYGNLTSVRNYLIIINSLFLEVAGVENLGTDYFYVERKGALMLHFLVLWAFLESINLASSTPSHL